MCNECWHEEGAPIIDTPAVREAAALVPKVYESSAVGGGMHVHLDDWNLENEFFDDEAEAWIRKDSHEIGADAVATELACFSAFKALSESERYSALALARGLWGGTPTEEHQ